MGGTAPGSSERCMQCRQRKKKCGSERPSCQRCINSGLMCSGPGEPKVFIHRNATNIASQSDRAALKAAFSARIGQGRLVPRAHVQASLSASATPTMPALFNPVNLEALDSVLRTSSTRSLYAAIADEFNPRLKVGIFSGDRLPSGNHVYSGLALCTRALIPLASLEIKLLDLGILGVLAKYIGTLRKDERLIGLARSSYTLALGEFHQKLGGVSWVAQSRQRDDRFFQVVLCICLTLQLFEMIDQNQPGAGLEAHVDGALSILRITGPELYKSQHLRHIFSGLRGIVTAIALRRRQEIFLAEPVWLHVPFEGAEKSQVEQLHDLALHLPALLERTDALQASSRWASTDRAMHELIHDYFELRSRFRQWFLHLGGEEVEQLYWFADRVSQDAQPVSDFDSVCVPLFPEHFQLRFRNGAKAGLLCHYWGFQLQLLMGLLDIASIERTPDNPDEPNKASSRLEIKSILSEAHELAQLILETIPYMSSCLEGRIAAQGPFAIVIRYLERSRGATGSNSLSEYASLWQSLLAS